MINYTRREAPQLTYSNWKHSLNFMCHSYCESTDNWICSCLCVASIHINSNHSSHPLPKKIIFRKCVSCCGFWGYYALHINCVEPFQGQYKDGSNGTCDFTMVSAFFLILRIYWYFMALFVNHHRSFSHTLNHFRDMEAMVLVTLRCFLRLSSSSGYEYCVVITAGAIWLSNCFFFSNAPVAMYGVTRPNFINNCWYFDFVFDWGSTTLVKIWILQKLKHQPI